MKIQYLYNEEDIARSFADLVPVCKCHAIMEQVYPSDNFWSISVISVLER